MDDWKVHPQNATTDDFCWLKNVSFIFAEIFYFSSKVFYLFDILHDISSHWLSLQQDNTDDIITAITQIRDFPVERQE